MINGDEYVQRIFGRVILSMLEDAAALDRMWADIRGVINSRRPAGMYEEDLLSAFAGHAAAWFTQRRGDQSSWLYVDTTAVADRLRAVLLDQIYPTDTKTTAELRESFCTALRQVSTREFDPYPACHRVCTQDPPQCLYRSAVADLIASGRYQGSWENADAVDAQAEPPRQTHSWQVAQNAAYELVEFPDGGTPVTTVADVTSAAKRAALCFEQQMLARDPRKVPRTARAILDRIIQEARHEA